MNTGHAETMLRVMRAALRAVEPAEAVHRHVRRDGETLEIGPQRYRLGEIERIFVVGGGKAGAPMAAALAELLPNEITAGLVNVKYGHTATSAAWDVRFGHLADLPVTRPTLNEPGTGPVMLMEAGHPTPDAAGLAGAGRIADLLRQAGPRDLVIALFSGGGSALLPLPVTGIGLDDYQALTTLLLRSGADITEINTVRKHCAQLQGGQMARLAAPARFVALILSDVVGSPLDVIASGPATPDPTTYADALAVLRRYDILDEIPVGIRNHLMRGATADVPETPKPGDPDLVRVANVVIGENVTAARAAAHTARSLGLNATVLTTYCQGEAREVGRVAAGLAQGIAAGQSDLLRPACVIFGGETTVTVHGDGMGGRNQELALAAAIALDRGGLPADADVAVVGLATDGTDGPTMAAGGLATGDTVARGRALGLDAYSTLARNDSLPYLDALGSLVLTGPTGTNVNDLIFVWCW